MREAEYKEWLKEGGALAEGGLNTRVYAVRTIETKLAELGSSHADLEAAWRDDQFAQLLQRLKKIKQDFLQGGSDYRLLMPRSDKPSNRLNSWCSWLRQYGQFLRGEPRSERDADRIRALRLGKLH